MSSYNQQQNQIANGAPNYGPRAPQGLPPGVGEFYKKQVYDPLDKLGYTGFRSDVKNWGEFGTHPGGPTGAMTDFNNILANAQQTGDLSQIEPFMRNADRGNRKNFRGGLFGTGLSISPLQLGLAGLGGFASAGGFGGAFGLPGTAPVASRSVSQGFLPTTFGNASAAAKAASSQLPVALGGPSAAAQIASRTAPSLFSGGANSFGTAASNVAQGVAQGSLPTFQSGVMTNALNANLPAATTNVANLTSTLPNVAKTIAGAATTPPPAATASLFDKIKDFISSPTAKSAALTQIIGGLSSIAGVGNAQEGLSQLRDDNADPELPAQTQRALDSLEESIRGVDRDAYIKEQMRQFTAGSSAAAGVDSGAYITGLQQVIGNSILELAKFQADGSYNMALVGQNAAEGARLNNEKLFATKFNLDMFQGANSGAIAGGALNFLFGAGNKEDGEKA
jgi:hypothetical protein